MLQWRGTAAAFILCKERKNEIEICGICVKLANLVVFSKSWCKFYFFVRFPINMLWILNQSNRNFFHLALAYDSIHSYLLVFSKIKLTLPKSCSHDVFFCGFCISREIYNFNIGQFHHKLLRYSFYSCCWFLIILMLSFIPFLIIFIVVVSQCTVPSAPYTVLYCEHSFLLQSDYYLIRP